MYNRYQGNSGSFVRMSDPEPPRRSHIEVPRRPGPQTAQSRPAPAQQAQQAQQARKRPPPAMGGGLGSLLPDGIGKGLEDILSGLRSKLSPESFETDDLLILLILYLMYRESGDKELLIMLGAMLLL